MTRSGIRLIVGLGNPGKKYEYTRHNIGRQVLARLAQDPPADAFLFMSEEFMNVCGPSVASEARRKGLAPDQLLLLVDDFELPLGRLRLRRGGSSGGHNGMKSIFEALGTQEVPRLRIGIGPVPEREDPANFVLQSFGAAEKTKISADVLPRAESAVRTLFSEGLDAAMNAFNSSQEPA